LENPCNAFWGLQSNIARAGQYQTLCTAQAPCLAAVCVARPWRAQAAWLGRLLDGFARVWQAIRVVDQ
tara:strand:+ start:51 stop:254 length:204 start_codon:yes stop_codon:yes gene_type:complete